jgi:hypothetical protein
MFLVLYQDSNVEKAANFPSCAQAFRWAREAPGNGFTAHSIVTLDGAVVASTATLVELDQLDDPAFKGCVAVFSAAFAERAVKMPALVRAKPHGTRRKVVALVERTGRQMIRALPLVAAMLSALHRLVTEIFPRFPFF